MAEPVETPRRNLTGAIVPALAVAALAAVGALLLVGRHNDAPAQSAAIPGCILGDNAAAIAIRWWLEDADPDQPSLTNWDSIIGDDEVCATAHVMIHEPAELTGLYEIHLERQITATGYVAEPDEHPDVVALLSAQTAAEEAV